MMERRKTPRTLGQKCRFWTGRVVRITAVTCTLGMLGAAAATALHKHAAQQETATPPTASAYQQAKHSGPR